MKIIKQTKNSRESGFSLVELLIAIAVMTIVVGVTLNGVNQVQKRNNAEAGKLDMTQQAREGLDQIVRDLHQAGYPTPLASPSASASPGITALTTGTQSSVTFQGDVNGDGGVKTVTYQAVVPGGAAGCPCSIQRTVNQAGASNTSTVIDNVTSFKLAAFKIDGSAVGGAADYPFTKRIDIELEVVAPQPDMDTKKKGSASFFASVHLDNTKLY